ncbi:delta(24)-sterol C-methyltransferase [Neosynechococcus sphagnicola sy1]|uniref:Delta(24)-sterol C-methyltransferase n=1 Tax=Neosynechococcus sphagnicola sy1 TaxID=1497020 RepID=A0A098TK57_9CYAN|nr:methyltransferase domain-containing protein [Neosynechococcus sphagnicola]KGF72689.1 delta(24)-sterol C-methyltransferase [Neosynechococcus sphagnicola sy1]
MTEILFQQIQQFYDGASGLWEQIWGEHMHHGYYGSDGQQAPDRYQAQIDLIEALLNWARVGEAGEILDVGCGIGGSSLNLAQRFQAAVTGITLSPVQVQRARERAAQAGLTTQAEFQVANALAMPFTDNRFDLVWSLESGEHMPDKAQFLQECYRVLRPGGTLILATWCHRPTHIQPLTVDEQQLLAAIYRVYCLPGVLSLPEYTAIAQRLELQNLRTADWSTAVAPFWDQVIDSAWKPAAIWGLLQAGWTTIQGAFALGLMQSGYRRGLIRYGVLTATKHH